MGTESAKAADNIYFRYRKEAAKYNDKLYSREGAAELLGISVSSLADYELGNTKYIPVDKINLMADLYNAPELRNYYCTHECPLGMGRMPELEVPELDRVTLKLMSSLKGLAGINNSLLDIVSDGVVSDDEIPKLKEIISILDEIDRNSHEFRLWAEKNVKK